jgi:hypothetical protein
MQLSDWPGITQRPAHFAPAVIYFDDLGSVVATLRVEVVAFFSVAVKPRAVFKSPRLFAVFGLTITALSHVSFVKGFGNSCSQPLLAKRPS